MSTISSSSSAALANATSDPPNPALPCDLVSILSTVDDVCYVSMSYAVRYAAAYPRCLCPLASMLGCESNCLDIRYDTMPMTLDYVDRSEQGMRASLRAHTQRSCIAIQSCGIHCKLPLFPVSCYDSTVVRSRRKDRPTVLYKSDDCDVSCLVSLDVGRKVMRAFASRFGQFRSKEM